MISALVIKDTNLLYDVARLRSDIMPCNKIDKLLVVYKFSGNVMTYCVLNDKIIMFLLQK